MTKDDLKANIEKIIAKFGGKKLAAQKLINKGLSISTVSKLLTDNYESEPGNKVSRIIKRMAG